MTDEAPNVIRMYEQNFGIITPMAADILKDLEGEYPLEWIAAAMREAVLSNAHSLRYVEGVLRRWRREGRTNRPQPQPAQTVGELFADRGAAEPVNVPTVGSERWTRVLDDLRVQVARPSFDTFLRDTVGIDDGDARLVVVCPTAFAANYLRTRMMGVIQRAVERQLGPEVEVVFPVKGDPEAA